MISLRQIEALHWIAQLGTFERAASKLNTTQSAISKRVQELELSSGIAIFDRSQRGARLTAAGEHLLSIGREMLALHDRMLGLKDGQDVPARRLRLGVTELSALTWLPRLVAILRETYPSVVIEPEVDSTRVLHERLLDDSIDLIVVPEVFSDPHTAVIRVGEVTNIWLAKPGVAKSSRALSLEELAEHTILAQGNRSGSGQYLSRWLKTQGIIFPRVITSDSLLALVGFAVAGLGISYLPYHCFAGLVADGKLMLVETEPTLPQVPYAAMYRMDRPSAFLETVADLIRQTCDFGRQFQDDPLPDVARSRAGGTSPMPPAEGLSALSGSATVHE